MTIVVTILAVLIGLLSIAAGAAKIALVPEEVEFLSQFGFTTVLTISFGIVQVLGGMLMVVPVSRFYGALIATVAFALSAVLLLVAGNLAFAGVSLVPVLLASWIAFRCYSDRRAIVADNVGD